LRVSTHPFGGVPAGGKKAVRLLLLGLDAAGKTTILCHLQGKPPQTVPTIGFNVDTGNPTRTLACVL
jgi:hypothetical protein